MMKLPIQVAPVQRDVSPARYATSRGITPSENPNLCSCHGVALQCMVNWNHCPDGYFPQCRGNLFNCFCWCCPNEGGVCLGPYE